MAAFPLCFRSALDRADPSPSAATQCHLLLSLSRTNDEHNKATDALPPFPCDSSDRLPISQAITERSLLLLTADSRLAAYPGPVLAV